MKLESGSQMDSKAKQITGGIYLVLDPSVERGVLLNRLEQALAGGVETVQIWNRWPEGFTRREKEELIGEVVQLVVGKGRKAGRGGAETAGKRRSRKTTIELGGTGSEKSNSGAEEGRSIPVLINEEWELLTTTALDGVHFDTISDDITKIREAAGREFICGITCGNDLETVAWAEQNGLDYISFCAMFPSVSAGECEIVKPETVRKAREITRLPLFISGGITTDNLPGLKDLEFDGVAVISGILNANSPEKAALKYQKTLQTMRKN